MPVTESFPTIAYGLGGAHSVTLGTFYRGGSFPRTWTLHHWGDVFDLQGYNLGGSYHASTIDIAGELRFADALGPDTELSDHHAFAAAIRLALAALGPPNPAPSDRSRSGGRGHTIA
jgi:hypothetical protein